MQMNGGKLAKRLETDVGSELTLTPCDVTHPGLAAVQADSTSKPNIREREREREGGVGGLIKAFN